MEGNGSVALVANRPLSPLPGLEELWAETLGDPRVKIAILDGPYDRGHSCFKGANLHLHPGYLENKCRDGPALQHGTHVSSIIFRSTRYIRGRLCAPLLRFSYPFGKRVAVWAETTMGNASHADGPQHRRSSAFLLAMAFFVLFSGQVRSQTALKGVGA